MASKMQRHALGAILFALDGVTAAFGKKKQAATLAAPSPPSSPPSLLDGLLTSEALFTALLCTLLFAPLFYFILNTAIPVLLGSQDLKKKYGAKWALVTGSSSGIGKELARRLLAQGLSVVLVARKEAVFDATAAELQSSFPDLSVLKVEADLSDGEGKWMPAVEAAVSGKDVQVCLTRTLPLPSWRSLNAGHMSTGLFG